MGRGQHSLNEFCGREADCLRVQHRVGDLQECVRFVDFVVQYCTCSFNELLGLLVVLDQVDVPLGTLGEEAAEVAEVNCFC